MHAHLDRQLNKIRCAARWDVPYKYDPSETLGSATANEFGWRNHRVFVWVGVSQLLVTQLMILRTLNISMDGFLQCTSLPAKAAHAGTQGTWCISPFLAISMPRDGGWDIRLLIVRGS